MHATSPTKAGESHTITYSRNVQLFITMWNCSQNCGAMPSKIYRYLSERCYRSEKTSRTFFIQKSKNNERGKNFKELYVNCCL